MYKQSPSFDKNYWMVKQEGKIQCEHVLEYPYYRQDFIEQRPHSQIPKTTSSISRLNLDHQAASLFSTSFFSLFICKRRNLLKGAQSCIHDAYKPPFEKKNQALRTSNDAQSMNKQEIKSESKCW